MFLMKPGLYLLNLNIYNTVCTFKFGLVWFGIYAQILGMYAAAVTSNQAKLKGYPGLRLAHPDSK